MRQPEIDSLALISDRNTCALLDKEGTISWYCPGAFDRPAIISSLIDQESGGFWEIDAEGKTFLNRGYSERGSILHTRFQVQEEELELIDFMPLESGVTGICRKTSAAVIALKGRIKIRGDYGLQKIDFVQNDNQKIHLEGHHIWIHCSQPLKVDGDVIYYHVPQGEECWIAMVDCADFDGDTWADCYRQTALAWRKIEQHVRYQGPFEHAVNNSLRALQQLVYAATGGIVAAPTMGLPEVIGGKRNYDYRYVWMRDAALITSSLVNIETDGKVEHSFLSFIAGSRMQNGQDHVSCFYGIDQRLRTSSRELPLEGYRMSKPVLEGNTAADQFQLDAESGLLLASAAIYEKTGERYEWGTVETIADFICSNWQRKDNGIWEEEQLQHYTSSKALAARALEVIIPFQDNRQTASRWRDSAAQIRNFVESECLTSYGAYSVYPGSEQVDISCALFSPFGYCEPDHPALKITMETLDRNYMEGQLYRRQLLEFDSAQEGVFLAASCWVAHHYALAGNIEKSKAIIEAVLSCANDLGYFSEEFDLKKGIMLGNFPQTFVHSSFICAVNGYREALKKQ